MSTAAWIVGLLAVWVTLSIALAFALGALIARAERSARAVQEARAALAAAGGPPTRLTPIRQDPRASPGPGVPLCGEDQLRDLAPGVDDRFDPSLVGGQHRAHHLAGGGEDERGAGRRSAPRSPHPTQPGRGR